MRCSRASSTSRCVPLRLAAARAEGRDAGAHGLQLRHRNGRGPHAHCNSGPERDRWLCGGPQSHRLQVSARKVRIVARAITLLPCQLCVTDGHVLDGKHCTRRWELPHAHLYDQYHLPRSLSHGQQYQHHDAGIQCGTPTLFCCYCCPGFASRIADLCAQNDNHDFEYTTLVKLADLSVDVFATPPTVYIDNPLVITIIVTNAGGLGSSRCGGRVL